MQTLFAAVKRDGTKVITGEVRLSYAHLFEPQAVNPGDDPKYSVSLLIPKTDVNTIQLMNAAVEEAKQNGIASTFGGNLPPNLKLPLRDGDVERPDDPIYAGHYFVGANSKTRPGLVKPSGAGQVVEITDSQELYSGCYAQVSVNFYAFNTRGNRGIACGLNNVLKTRDGESLGGRARAEDDFGMAMAAPVGGDDFLS